MTAHAREILHDTLGRVVQITKPDGTLSTFGYDAAGQLTQLRHLFGVGARQGTVFHRTLSQSVDIMGDISESQLLVSAEVNGVSLLPLGPGGVFSHAVSLSVGINPFRVRATDATGRPVERLVVVERMAGAGDTPGLLPVREGLQFDFSHDATGNITGLHDSRYGASNYQYDALQRLVAAARPPGAPVPAENYAYDPLGNRVSSHLSAAHAHDAANRLLNDDHYIYEYDAGGNRTARVRRADLLREEYIHNAENRLVGYMMLSGSEMLRQARYVYDGLGRRVARLVDLGGDGAADECVYYGYSGENVIREISCSYAGSLEPFAALGSFGVSNSASTLLFHGPGIDQPIGFWRENGEGDANHITDEDFYGMHTDHLGSVEVITSYTGSALVNYYYDSFGNIVKVTDTDGVELPLGQSQESYPLANRFLYTGREHDPETGLYFYRARYYDAGIGRFLEEDPRFSDNLYTYVAGNPLKFLDPKGEGICDYAGVLLPFIGFAAGFALGWSGSGGIPAIALLGAAIGSTAGSILGNAISAQCTINSINNQLRQSNVFTQKIRACREYCWDFKPHGSERHKKCMEECLQRPNVGEMFGSCGMDGSKNDSDGDPLFHPTATPGGL